MNVHVISVESYEDIYMLSCIAGSYGSSIFFLKWEKKLLAKNDGRNGESLRQVMKGWNWYWKEPEK